MSNFALQDETRIDRVHGGAIREEIGERLSLALHQPSAALPDRLLTLMQQFAKPALPARIKSDFDT